jgi:hypothetical protein
VADDNKIAAAINADRARQIANAKPAEIKMQLSTGRIVVLVVPKDMNSTEALDLCAYVASPGGLSRKLGELAQTSKIVVASSIPTVKN